MEHGVKTGGKHQHTFMLLTWPVYAELKELKACKTGKGDIYMENKVYFELTTKHIKYLQQIQHWNFIKNACSNTKQ